MPVGQPTAQTPIYLGRVITVDPTQRIVDVVLNASGQRVEISTTPICSRWPQVGETWSVHFINNTPYLGEPYQQSQSLVKNPIESVPAGDAWINTPTGKLHIIGSPDGSTDYYIPSPGNVGANRTLLTNGTGGTYWSIPPTQVYSQGPITIPTNIPTDIAIAPPSGGIVLASGQQITAMAFCIINAGSGTTALNLGFGIHHPDSSGGTTWENLQIESAPAVGGFRAYSRMSVYTTTQAWTDATIRFAITQVGASVNGNAYGVGLRVFTP